MITLKLRGGGLGNQMFEYAIARTLVHRGFKVKLDADWKYVHWASIKAAKNNKTQATQIEDENIHARELELTKFNITVPILHNDPTEFFAYYHCFTRKIVRLLLPEHIALFRYFRHFYPHKRDRLIQKINSSRKTNPDADFDIYFNEIESILRQEFRPKSLSQGALRLQEQITSAPDSVFLHIRRGDFLLPQHWQFVKLGSAYYNGALKLITQRLKSPTIFIFSDDLEWCKNNLLNHLDPTLCKKLEFVFVGNNNQANAVEDLALMSSCQHGIGANSTFSFWGAYLIDNPQKIICTPAQHSYVGGDIDWYPKSWRKIDVYWGYEHPRPKPPSAKNQKP